MFFNKKADFDRKIERSQKDHNRPEIKRVMEENSNLIDWKDVTALIVAGIQVIAPKALLLILMYSLIGLFFFYVVAN